MIIASCPANSSAAFATARRRAELSGLAMTTHIEALRSACRELGLTLLQNADARGYYGNETKGDYVVQLKGPYDIALNKQADGTFGITSDLCARSHQLPLEMIVSVPSPCELKASMLLGLNPPPSVPLPIGSVARILPSSALRTTQVWGSWHMAKRTRFFASNPRPTGPPPLPARS